MTDKTIRIVLETMMKGNAGPKLNQMSAQVDALVAKARKLPAFRAAQAVRASLPAGVQADFIKGFADGLQRGMADEMAKLARSPKTPRRGLSFRAPSFSLSRFGISRSGINPLGALAGGVGSIGSLAGMAVRGAGPLGVVASALFGVVKTMLGVVVGIGAILTTIAMTNKEVRAAFAQMKKAAASMFGEIARIIAPAFKTLFRIGTVMFQRWADFFRASKQGANISAVLASAKFTRQLVLMAVMFERWVIRLSFFITFFVKIITVFIKVVAWVSNLFGRLGGVIGQFFLSLTDLIWFQGVQQEINDILKALGKLPESMSGGMDKALRDWINGNERMNRPPSVGEIQNRYTRRARHPINININVSGVEGAVSAAMADIARQTAWQMAGYLGGASAGSY